MPVKKIPQTKSSANKSKSTQSKSHSSSKLRGSSPSLLEEEITHPSTSGLKKKGPKTKIIVKYDTGFPNNLYIRGNGANLRWDKGVLLKNTKEDEWVWETNDLFSACQFKVLLNDAQYEDGENHEIRCGAFLEYSPHF